MFLIDSIQLIQKKEFTIEIFGLGYVGFPLAIKLSSNGFKVNGIDINLKRIERLKNNVLMDSEIHLKNDFEMARNDGTLILESSPKKSEDVKVGIICVPTPIPKNDVKSDIYVIEAVNQFLEFSKHGDIIILESSIEIGTTKKILEMINSKGYKIGIDFGLCFCPERIDPANKEWGIENIPRIIYCTDDISYNISKELYNFVNGGNLLRVSKPEVAEIVKSFENAFRLVNISLVNELAMLCDKLKINVKEIIDAASTKPFGFMAHYSGAGAGGHCIPKDPRFLIESAKKHEVEFLTIKHAIEINNLMPQYVANSIEDNFKKMQMTKSILVCGLSYKANVEDMRDSASFKIITELKNRGFEVYGFDPYFNIQFLDKYLVENNLQEINFEIIDNIDEVVLQRINGICIVQHHEQIKNKIYEIYEKSLVPFIYDCQNKIEKNDKFTTILDCLGN